MLFVDAPWPHATALLHADPAERPLRKVPLNFGAEDRREFLEIAGRKQVERVNEYLVLVLGLHAYLNARAAGK